MGSDIDGNTHTHTGWGLSSTIEHHRRYLPFHSVIAVTQKFVHHKINLPENDVTPISRREERITTT